MSDRTITPTQDVTVATEADHQEMPRAPDTYGPRWFNYNAFSDDDIASEFGVALAKLEELLYAVYGALPDYANDELWYHRANPRALWPEQKTTWVGYGPVQERYDYHQYPATGYVTGLALHSDQQIGARVPIRSRSGDPQLQYVMAEHEPEFGRGTVERDYSASPHDPPNDQAVEVRWSPPPGTSVESATLRTNRGSHTMTEDNGTWRAAADAEDQGTWVGWYIEGSVDRGGDLPETIYEPKTPTGVDPTYRTPPSDEHERLTDSAYTWVSFTHTLGPYAYGLPEQITRLGDTESSPPGLKKSTETWEFDKFENIQCAHVNLARFALDQLGRDLQHSPHQRGNDENCCFNMPIKWRWSGSNVPWQYVGGGKGGTSEVQPLHNLEENAGSGAARRSWRGMPMLFKDDPFESGWPVNFSYGGDESWGAPYADVWSDVEVRDEYHVGLMYDAGLKAGLQPGDAIDRTHLLEIIAAVDYLITKGCWRTATIHSARMSPMTAFGRTCGYFEDHLGPIEPSCNNQCCASCDPPYAMPADCTPYSAPSWEDCTRFERCDMWRSRSYRCTEPSSVTFAHDVECDVTVGNNSTNYACSHLPGGSGPIDCNIFEQVFGWAAFLCGPRRSDNGPGEGTYPSGNPLWSDHDDDHGNGLRKLRRGDWPPGDILNAGIRSYGNSYEKVTHCRNDTDNPGHPDVGFEEVTPVKWEGLTPGWIGEATCTPGNFITGIPWSPVPGLGEFLPDGETPICTAHDNAEPFPERVTGGSCAVGNNVGDYCMGNNCYVQIDLNLHGGVPRLKDYVMGIRLLTDGGGPISPAVWEWSDYPCATAPDLTDKPCGS